MANIIVALIIVLIITLAIYKIVSEKRRGVKCVGCALSEGGGCSSKKAVAAIITLPQNAEQQIAFKEVN